MILKLKELHELTVFELGAAGYTNEAIHSLNKIFSDEIEENILEKYKELLPLFFRERKIEQKRKEAEKHNEDNTILNISVHLYKEKIED